MKMLLWPIRTSVHKGLLLFIAIILIACDDNIMSSQRRFDEVMKLELVDSFSFLRKEERRYDHSRFDQIGEDDYHTLHYIGSDSVIVNKVGDSKSTIINIESSNKLLNRCAVLRKPTELVKFNSDDAYNVDFELEFFDPNGLMWSVREQRSFYEDTNLIGWAYTSPFCSISILGRHILIPFWTRTKGLNRFPRVSPNDMPQAAMHYVINDKKKSIVYQGLIGRYPFSAEGIHQFDMQCQMQFDISEKNDTFVLICFSKNDTCQRININSNLEIKNIFHSTDSTEFGACTTDFSVSEQMYSHEFYKHYSDILSFAGGYSRTVILPSKHEKSSYKKESKFNNKFNNKFNYLTVDKDFKKRIEFEYDIENAKVGLPVFSGANGIYRKVLGNESENRKYYIYRVLD